MTNKNKCIINKPKSIKKYLSEHKIRIYDEPTDDKNIVITIDQDMYVNDYFEMDNKDYGYTTIRLESHLDNSIIKIKIYDYKKYSISKSTSGNCYVLIVKDAEILYKDKHTIYIN